MSFKTRAASLGELNGGQGASDVATDLERCKSARSLEKKKSFKFRSKHKDENKKLSRTSSVRSLTNLLQRFAGKVSNISVQLPTKALSFSTVSNGDVIVEKSSYKKREEQPENNTDSSCDKPPEVLSLTGIKNHGNTCFMNAVIQCLAHTDLLAEYFVLGNYKHDMKLRKGQNKKFGTRGEVTEKLAHLLRNLWCSQYHSQLSSDFKAVVGKHGVQYRGYAQHDAQEFFLWLLDKVHEDLNRATKKKYKPNKDNVGRSDECIANESLLNHMRCNDSIVLDLFQAQYRSSLACPQCDQQSTTFDPFLCLSLPIPQRDTRPIYVTVVFVGSSRTLLRIGVSVPVYSKIAHLSKAVSEMTEIPTDRLVITELTREGFHRSFQDHQSISIIHEGDNIYAFEAPKQLYPDPESLSDKPLTMSDGDGGTIQDSLIILVANCVGRGKNARRFGPPFVFHVLREVTFTQLQSIFIQGMRRILQDNVEQQANKHSPLFALRIMNGLPGKCYLSHEIDHPLYQATVDAALVNGKDSSTPGHIRMIIEWEPETREQCVKSDTNGSPEEHASVREMEIEYKNSHTVTLNDCFSLYTRDEKLGEEDAWLCPKCKKHQQGTVKRLSLWSLPEVLVVHLKRFRQISTGRTKLHTMVEFPVSDLDMTPHLEPRRKSAPESSLPTWSTWRRNRRNSSSGNEDNLYDLYAVCNHMGTMSGGHYTAYCKNPTDGGWYLYDDTRVEKLPSNEVATNAAYLLFYSRRNVGSSSASESSGSSDHWTRKIPQVLSESLASSREELDEEESPPNNDKTAASSTDASDNTKNQDKERSQENLVLAESCV